MDLFRNYEVKYPKDKTHLLQSHTYFEVFSPKDYVDIHWVQTLDVIQDLQLKSWCARYNEISGTMQEYVRYAVDTRAHQVALKCRVTIEGQPPTGICDVMEVLADTNMWSGDQLLL